MFLRYLPPGIAEFLLFAVVVGVGIWLIRAWGNRKNRQTDLPNDDILPILETQQRVSATVLRVYRDGNQGVQLIEARVGRRTLTFCAADYSKNSSRYEELLKEKIVGDVALYALATLEPGDVTTIRDQIRDFEKINPTPDFVTLLREGQYANDYFVVANLLDARSEKWDDDLLTVYRSQVVRANDLTLVIDLAVQPPNAEKLTVPGHAHGSARLFGYLANPAF